MIATWLQAAGIRREHSRNKTASITTTPNDDRAAAGFPVAARVRVQRSHDLPDGDRSGPLIVAEYGSPAAAGVWSRREDSCPNCRAGL